jgi:hypothetical protein
VFSICSRGRMETAFKIVKVYGATDEVLARIDNFEICRAAFEKALFVYPKEHLELRQGAQGELGDGGMKYQQPRMDIELVPSKLYTMAKPLK